MSKPAVLSFIAKVNADPALKKQLDGVSGDIPGMLGVASRAGFEFTRDEWFETVAEIARQTSGELDADDLDRVSGGTGTALPQAPIAPKPPNMTNFGGFIAPKPMMQAGFQGGGTGGVSS